jgi:hypothetical protein
MHEAFLISQAEGFEPPSSGAKTHCLTTWLRLILSVIVNLMNS